MTFPKIMGIVNVTPDSFSDGGQFTSHEAAVEHALVLVDQGADILDVGGESTRPGASPVPADQEYERVIPVIEGIRKHNREVAISVDTSKAIIAKDAVEAGATMINDVTAGRHDPLMFRVAADADTPLVLMHMQGEPRTMQEQPTYQDVVADVSAFLQERVDAARTAGVRELYVDPGIGFGKTLEHNLALLRSLETFDRIAPVVLGISRKRFLGMLTGIEQASDRDHATALMHALLLPKRAAIVRVHNVEEVALLRTLADALVGTP